MSDVFYLRPIDPPIGPADVDRMAQHAGSCFNLHRVDWVQSYLAADGGRMLCWYRAPDAESVRIALRQLGSDMNAVWAGTVGRDGAAAADYSLDECVVVEISLDEPPKSKRLNELRDAISDALRNAGLGLAQSFTSTNGTRLVCIVRAKNDASVKSAIIEAGLAPSSVWRCAALTPKLP